MPSAMELASIISNSPEPRSESSSVRHCRRTSRPWQAPLHPLSCPVSPASPSSPAIPADDQVQHCYLRPLPLPGRRRLYLDPRPDSRHSAATSPATARRRCVSLCLQPRRASALFEQRSSNRCPARLDSARPGQPPRAHVGRNLQRGPARPSPLRSGPQPRVSSPRSCALLGPAIFGPVPVFFFRSAF